LTISVVLADDNILFSRTLRDYVLYAADEGAIEVHWSREILSEMSTASPTRCGQSTRRPYATHPNPKLTSWPPSR
jgi:hypothetical protein